MSLEHVFNKTLVSGVEAKLRKARGRRHSRVFAFGKIPFGAPSAA